MVFSVALASCAGLPDSQTGPQPKAIETYPAAQSLQGPEGAWPMAEWWTAYGDPQLDSLMAEGLRDAPDLRLAEARLHKANALAEAAGAALWPTLDASAKATADKISYNQIFPSQFLSYLPKGYHDTGIAQLDFTYELDFWGKNRDTLNAAVSDEAAAAADHAQARLALSTAIAAAYADFISLAADRDVALRSVDVRKETLDLVQRRLDHGLDTRATLKQAEAEFAGARAELAAIDETIGLARNRIAALIGSGPDRGLAIAVPPAPELKAFGLPPRLALDLLGRRPDIIAARWRVEAAASRIGVAEAQFYPNIDLIASIGVQSLGLYKLIQPGSDFGSDGVAVSLPIFDGGRLRANLKSADADFDGAVATYDATIIEALHEVADVTASNRALAIRLSTSHEALSAAEDSYRLARLRYQGQLADYQTVLTAENTMLANRRIVADLEARAFVLDVALVRALGGGFIDTSSHPS